MLKQQAADFKLVFILIGIINFEATWILNAIKTRVDSVLKIPEISGVESISSSAYWRDFVLWSCLGALAPQ